MTKSSMIQAEETMVIKHCAVALLTAGCVAFASLASAQMMNEPSSYPAKDTQKTPAMQDKAAEETAPTSSSSGEDLPVYMSVDYIKKFCERWNNDELLTVGLANSEWVDNDGDKGYKVIQLYRRDCPDSEPVEMQFERQDGKAMCVYAGKVENPDLDRSADYEMYADTKRWVEMGNGEYGPMKAMMFGRLKFKGPKMEAMGNMGPFKNLRLMFGTPGDTSKCP